MDKRERYISYVINDLIRNTKIDYELERIEFPFSFFPFSFSLFISYPAFHSLTFSSNYIKEMYGVPESMSDSIWDQYKNIIKDKVDGQKV